MGGQSKKERARIADVTHVHPLAMTVQLATDPVVMARQATAGILSGIELNQHAWLRGFEMWNHMLRMNPFLAQQQDTVNAQWATFLNRFSGERKTPGKSAGGQLYGGSKRLLQDAINHTPQPMRGFVQYQLLHNPVLQDMLRSDQMADLLELIGNSMPGEGLLHRPDYNNTFLTEDSNGKIVPMDADAIVALFRNRTPDAEGEVFPHIIMTSSHAQAESLEDVTSITHGIRALARDSEEQPLPMGFTDRGVKAGQTLMLYACDTRRNPYLNAAALLRRINVLKKVAETGTLETSFDEISPGAKRIAKLMLKCMAEDPSLIDVNDPRPMREIAADRTTPITLRADAVHIAHHFQLIGYSKGGNVVSDAMRYLIAELSSKNGQGGDIFHKHEESQTRTRNDCSMNTRNIHNLVRSISVMAIASIEVGLTDVLKHYGLRRVAFNNKNDAISAHQNYHGCKYDERWLIEGVSEDLGHNPRDIMGTLGTPDPETGQARPARKGNALADKRVARRMKEAFAANYGKAAIGYILLNGRACDGEVSIETATGTTEAQIRCHEENILRAVELVGLRNAKLTEDGENPGVLTLKCPGVNFDADVRALKQLKRAFEYLREQKQGLVIAQAILDEDISRKIATLEGPEAGTPNATIQGPVERGVFREEKAEGRAA